MACSKTTIRWALSSSHIVYSHLHVMGYSTELGWALVEDSVEAVLRPHTVFVQGHCLISFGGYSARKHSGRWCHRGRRAKSDKGE